MNLSTSTCVLSKYCWRMIKAIPHNTVLKAASYFAPDRMMTHNPDTYSGSIFNSGVPSNQDGRILHMYVLAVLV